MIEEILAKIHGEPTILVTHPEIGDEAIDLLRQKCKVIICQSVPPVRSEILEKCKGADGILWASSERINSEVLDAAGSQLRSISLFSAGYENADVAELKRRRIQLGHVPSVHERAVADLAIGLMIAAARRFHEGRQCIENLTWQKFKLRWLLGQEISGATVGFFGFGSIGQTIAKRLSGFEIGRIIYNKRKALDDKESYKGEYVTFEQLLKESDFLFITAPLTDETRAIFNESAFNKMKENAVLVNVARGGIVDQQALYNALTQNKIFAAGLDVMSPEPLPPNDPILTLPNLVLAPHIGSATTRTREGKAITAAQNVLQGLAGEPMLAPVYTLN